jgi:uncharacterized damage-inducible protein DinB
MTISQSLLPEFDHEFANLRKTLERVPEGQAGFRPHDKSMTLGRLAGHLAECPMWGIVSLDRDLFDIAPPGQPHGESYVMTSRAELLARFDADLAKARAAIASTSDAAMMQPWTFAKGGKPLVTMPRIAVLRGYLLNHMIHHRAQLGVYLRLVGVPVPALYGPSADEQ